MISRTLVQPVLLAAAALALMLAGEACSAQPMTDRDFTLLTFPTADGGEIEGALFSKSAGRVVILFHGQVFNKESWFEFARILNAAGVDAFCVDFRGYGRSSAPSARDFPADVRGAIEAMRARGYRKIGLLGGSLGGAAILGALGPETPPEVDRVAILAGFGPGIASPTVDKLFVAAEGDPAFDRLREAFEKSTEPRRLEILEGNLHAQHLFKGDQAARLTAILKDFFTRP